MIFSHSNAFALNRHSRNVPDDVLRAQGMDDAAIEKAVEEWPRSTAPNPTISDVADHIDHIRKVAGIDHVGIGADLSRSEAPLVTEPKRT